MALVYEVEQIVLLYGSIFAAEFEEVLV